MALKVEDLLLLLLLLQFTDNIGTGNSILKKKKCRVLLTTFQLNAR
jgi:hypothetical protein